MIRHAVSFAIAAMLTSLLQSPATASPLVGGIGLLLGPVDRLGAELELGWQPVPLRAGTRYAPYWRGGFIWNAWGSVVTSFTPNALVGLSFGYCEGGVTYPSFRPSPRLWTGALYEHHWDRLYIRFSPNVSLPLVTTEAQGLLMSVWPSVMGFGQPWLEIGYQITPTLRLSALSGLPAPVKVTSSF